MYLRKSFHLAVAVVLAITASISSISPSRANEIRNYKVAFTGGVGVRLREKPKIDALGFGESGTYSIPEGAYFPAECEEYGDWVTNVNGETTNIYMRAPGGVYVSTAYLYTGVNSRVGLQLCSELDAKRKESFSPKTISAYHREGKPEVMAVDEKQRSARVYFSKKKTKEVADAMNKAAVRKFWAEAIFCATEGAILAVVTNGGKLAISTATGAGASVLCSVLAANISPQEFEPAKGAANAAASADKCYEVRMERAADGKTWKANTWTVTDSPDYCA